MPGHHYFIGWVPGRSLDTYTVLVFDRTDHKVAHFGRFPVESLEQQIKGVAQLSRHYNGAVVRTFDRESGALITSARNAKRFGGARQVLKARGLLRNLALLMGDTITIPDYPELQAELDVFKSDFTLDGSADYSLQVAQQSGIQALCLVTYDLGAELIYRRQPSIYFSYDRDLMGDMHFSRWS